MQVSAFRSNWLRIETLRGLPHPENTLRSKLHGGRWNLMFVDGHIAAGGLGIDTGGKTTAN